MNVHWGWRKDRGGGILYLDESRKRMIRQLFSILYEDMRNT